MKELNKEGIFILNLLINIIETPDCYSEVSKKVIVSTIKIIMERLRESDTEIFILDISEPEHNKYLKNLFDEYDYEYLNDEIKKTYRGVKNENS